MSGAPGKLRSAVAAAVTAALAMAAQVGVHAREYVFRWRDAVSHVQLAPHLVGAADVMSRRASPDHPVVWLSYASLAREWRVTERQAIERVRGLEDAGVIRKFSRHRRCDREDGEARSNVYVLVAPPEALARAVRPRGERRSLSPEPGAAGGSAAPAPADGSLHGREVAKTETHRAGPGPAKAAVRPEDAARVLAAIRNAPELADLEASAAKLVGVGRMHGRSVADVCRALAELAEKTAVGCRATYTQAIGFVRTVTPEHGPVQYAEDDGAPLPTYDPEVAAFGARGVLAALRGGSRGAGAG